MTSDVMDADLILRLDGAVAVVPARVRYSVYPVSVIGSPARRLVDIDGIAVEHRGAWVAVPLVTELLADSDALREAVEDHDAGRRDDARSIARAD